jgi:hypothetical protein
MYFYKDAYGEHFYRPFQNTDFFFIVHFKKSLNFRTESNRKMVIYLS